MDAREASKTEERVVEAKEDASQVNVIINKIVVRKDDLIVEAGPIGVLGLGMAGLFQALEFTTHGFRVIGFDVDTAIVSRLRTGRCHVPDVPAGILAEAFNQGRLEVTSTPSALSEANVFVISVPTEVRHDGMPCVAAVEQAVELVAANARERPLVIMKSTAYPGMTEAVVGARLRSQLGPDGFHLAYVPERGDPGNRDLASSGETARVIAGATPTCTRLAAALYERLGSPVHLASSIVVAELVKLHENVFRFINIAYINEFATFCRGLGVDPAEVVELAASKPFGFMPFWPGPGVGGKYLPVNAAYLRAAAQWAGSDLVTVAAAQTVNGRLPKTLADEVEFLLGGSLRDAEIVVLGASYKPANGDLRDSAAIRVCQELQARGASVRVIDPHAPATQLRARGLHPIPLAHDALDDADAIVLLTRHPEFGDELLDPYRHKLLDPLRHHVAQRRSERRR